jgi:excinuclease ABC subunit C
MVCFIDGKPKNSEYKRFSIKTVQGPDDFASMREVLTRRYRRLKKNKETLPDLIVVDGGKGQLTSGIEALLDVGIFNDVPIIGLAKRLEEIFVPGKSDSIMLPKTSSGLKLLQRLRDEAHRFAITFHRDKRSKRTFRSELTDIEGVGKLSAQKLLKKFGSVKKVSGASLEELVAESGAVIGNKIFVYFHPDNDNIKIEYDD